ncbi:RNA-binding cell elongation regulator Jag/EloR [Paenibacillus chondroitinus]|uniref:RNA-binding protein KhpB n=1 Tax=Paenibacillus chondroitinus TaxID=59842 RepID=A0ABU6DI98_9BACL|nr:MULTISPECIES: RNA-binding cell elongation regulator Jag/EloR [Paenibacillus]MCY9657707.1 protein jag [Paenibacillus anseongense]MEB4797474.1 RNA-binding cell elongation regulator Jag/EloR [Paenibacillus chondroitinus]
MKKIVVTGKTIEIAVKAGLSQWQVSEDRVKIHILEQPSRGLFGFIGSKEAKVELELIPDPLEEAIAFLQDMFEAMKISITIDTSKDREGYQLNMSGSELGILIGKRGQTLDALQYLVNIVANRYANSHFRIILDAENFRDRRKKTLEELALRLANRVIKSKKEVILEPMNSQERKIIHAELQGHPVVKTYSKGEEPNRRVVIAVK